MSENSLICKIHHKLIYKKLFALGLTIFHLRGAVLMHEVLEPIHHFDKAVKQLAPIKNDDRTADLIDDIEHFLIKIAPQN